MTGDAKELDASLSARMRQGAAPSIARDAFAPIADAEAMSQAVGRRHSDWNVTSVYGLGFLTLISAFNYFDRSILGLAMPQIKAEMHLSDTAMGLVSGLAFILFYSIMSVPIAWAADRWNRRNIIAAGLAFWSLMTLATGWVTNIVQLAIARFLMGAGEACGLAPSNSMTADLFRPERRPLAYSIFATATAISSILFFPIAGWIGQQYGWRQMFVAAGIPGIGLAILFLLTVQEPARGAADTRKDSCGFRDEHGPSFRQSARYLVGVRAYLALVAGATLMGLNIFASSVWTPTFLTRVHHLSLAEVAATIGPVRGFCGLAGILLGGMLIDRLGRRAASWRMTIPAMACICLGPAEALFALSDTESVWLGAFAVSAFLLLIHQGPVFAGVMAIAPLGGRAVATSILLFCSAMFGQAVGPFAVGLMNDVLEPALGTEAIRYSMLIIAVTAVLAGFSFLLAGRWMARDVQAPIRAVSWPAANQTT
ncbi:MAG: MFS transporter [Sphingobium sp.]|nr:MFS transporter [Sphingobium sp.]